MKTLFKLPKNLLSFVALAMSVLCLFLFFGRGNAFAGMPYPKIFVHGINSDCSAMHNLIENVREGRPYVKCVTVAGWVSDDDDFPFWTWYAVPPITPIPITTPWHFNKSELPRTDPDSFWNVDYYYNPGGCYDRSVGIETYAKWLERIVENIKGATGTEKVIFVAHSMGGLVVRRYMANSYRNWESVYRFVTLGTPSLGVYGILGLVGMAPVPDVHDCDDSSGFIRKLYTDWFNMNQFYKNNPNHAQNKIWGVVGGVFGGWKRNDPTQGDGIVEMWSAIPGEWLLACQQFDEPAYNTPNYGFRLAYGFKHVDLNTKEAWGSKLAIKWADSNEHADEPNTPGFTIYRHADYNRNQTDFRKNYPLTFTASISNLHGFLVDHWGDWWDENHLFNDNISSLSIDAGEMEIVVYEHADYQGRAQTIINESIPNFAGSYVGNDTISSIQILKAAKVPTVDLVLENKTINTTQIYQATNSITAGPSFLIEPPGDVTFRAGNVIRLLPGFTAQSGSKFHASIEVAAAPALSPHVENEAMKQTREQLHHGEAIHPTAEFITQQPRLYQNYPNPFNPETWIPYQLSEDAQVILTIYNMTGAVVRTIEVGLKPAGRYSSKGKAIHWDGRNEFGERVANGVYFYRIEAGDFTAMRKMAIIK